MSITISTGTITDCLEISSLIPEFVGTAYNKSEYEKRLKSNLHVILIARLDDALAGFKVGYDRDQNGTFYSWMGGVIPAFRKKGIASALAKEQENILIENGYTALEFKTRNYLKPMLVFGLMNGFDIVQVENREPVHQSRIILRKQLK